MGGRDGGGLHGGMALELSIAPLLARPLLVPWFGELQCKTDARESMSLLYFDYLYSMSCGKTSPVLYVEDYELILKSGSLFQHNIRPDLGCFGIERSAIDLLFIDRIFVLP